MKRQGGTTLILVLFLAGITVFIGVMLLLGWWIQPPSAHQANSVNSILLPDDSTTPRGTQSKKPLTISPVRKNEVRIYFTPDGLKLQAQVMQLPQQMEPYRRLRFVLGELLRGPQGGSLQSPIPKNVQLKAAYLMQDTAVVDLTDDMFSDRLGGTMTEWLCVAAIVNTVVDNVEGVRRVRLMVNGQAVQTLWGDVDISAPLSGDPSLIVE